MTRINTIGCIVVALALAITANAATVRVTGGAFYLGSRLSATNFVLGSAATLSGSGEVRAPAMLSGTVSPGTNTADIGNLSFTNRVTLSSATFLCHAASDTNLDRISATGAVSGSATVTMSRNAGVSPVRQIIIKGGAESDYASFVVSPATEWILGEAGALDLVVSLGQLLIPQNLAATDGTYQRKVALIWNAATGATGYQVWRHTTSNSASASLMGTATQTNYSDLGPTAGTIYYYWIKATSTLGSSAFSPSDSGWGASVSVGVSADYDGDHKADPVIYDETTGTWKARLSSGDYVVLMTLSNWFGGQGYAAVSADYDGDQKADPAVYQESTGRWIILPSSMGYATLDLATIMGRTFGGPGYSGIPADFDGDQKADPAIYERNQGNWHAMVSVAGYNIVDAPTNFLGGTNYWAVPGIYNPDVFADPIVFGETNGNWVAKLSPTYDPALTFADLFGVGGTGYIPVPADYDGDGLTDPAIRSETGDQWMVMLSTAGYAPFSVELTF